MMIVCEEKRRRMLIKIILDNYGAKNNPELLMSSTPRHCQEMKEESGIKF
jgi:hypothetical protein